MKKQKKGSAGVLVLGVVGLAAVAGFVAVQRGGLGQMPGFLPVPDTSTSSTGSTGTPYTPAPVGVDAGRYYGSLTDKYAYLWGGKSGTVVTGGGATLTPTTSSDRSPTSGSGVDVPIKFGVGYR